MTLRLSRLRVPLGWLVALSVLYVATPTPRAFALGVPLAVIGLLVRAIAAGTIRKGRQLARTGLYALTRNPLYLGSSLIAMGFGIMSGNLAGAALLVVPSAIVYPIVIRNEERELAHRFGEEFSAYRSQVPCFLPHRLRRGILETWSLAQFISNREYNAAIGFVLATGLLTARYLFWAA